MDISKMWPDEKSERLALLCKWEIVKAEGEYFHTIFANNMTQRVWKTATGNWPDLYHPGNMALAWRVINYAAENLSMLPQIIAIARDERIFEKSPNVVQRILLDKILEMATVRH